VNVLHWIQLTVDVVKRFVTQLSEAQLAEVRDELRATLRCLRVYNGDFFKCNELKTLGNSCLSLLR